MCHPFLRPFLSFFLNELGVADISICGVTLCCTLHATYSQTCHQTRHLYWQMFVNHYCHWRIIISFIGLYSASPNLGKEDLLGSIDTSFMSQSQVEPEMYVTDVDTTMTFIIFINYSLFEIAHVLLVFDNNFRNCQKYAIVFFFIILSFLH